MLNIPIYRAKKIDSDEYVEGYFNHCEEYGLYYISIFSDGDNHNYDIDPTTLSIHFPDMLDSEGTKIFASLSESGRGGDIIRFTDRFEWYRGTGIFTRLTQEESYEKCKDLPYEERTVIQDQYDGLNYSLYDMKEGRWKVTGIQND